VQVSEGGTTSAREHWYVRRLAAPGAEAGVLDWRALTREEEVVSLAFIEREDWLRTAALHANRLDAHVADQRLSHDHDLNDEKQAQDGESEDDEKEIEPCGVQHAQYATMVLRLCVCATRSQVPRSNVLSNAVGVAMLVSPSDVAPKPYMAHASAETSHVLITRAHVYTSTRHN
jgi:hypothetical protein